MEHYLDNAATTRVCREAAEAALAAMEENYGNPSSGHSRGRRAKALLEQSRDKVAKALGCESGELYFSSGGTESDNWAILSGAASARRVGRHLISSQVEHDAVRRSLDLLESQGWSVTRLKPDSRGGIEPAAVAEALRPDTALVSLMLVNNETGAVTDVAAVARLLKEAGSRALLHCDAVQAFLKISFSPKALGVDLLSVSGHKIHAPKGVGALYIRKGLRLNPLHLGGGQEGGLRPGTEPMPAIAAFAAAAELGRQHFAEDSRRMAELRGYALELLTKELPQLRYIQAEAPHILSIALPGYRSEVLMNFLEEREIYLSKSSACKKGGRSHVLEAMGLPARHIDGALRLGLSRYTVREDLEALGEALSQACRQLAHR